MKIIHKAEIERLLPKNDIPRSLHAELYQHFFEEEVTVLYGPRQVGKSSEIAKCLLELVERNDVDIHYFNLDRIPKDFENPEHFIQSILAQKADPSTKSYVILDEAQRVPNIGLFIKYIYDKKLPIKFVVTGSASLDIKEKIKEPLTGRKKEFFMGPLTLPEILKARGVDTKQMTGSFDLTDQILEEYMIFGGYPAVVTALSHDKKRDKLNEIADSYIMHDIAEIFKIVNPRHIELVATYMAENIGGILSIENMSMMTTIKRYELEKLMTALEKTFVLWLIPPFSKKRVGEITHRPKIYFYDLGIRNAVVRKLNASFMVHERGKIFENVIALELMSQFGSEQIKYWRTTNQTEVDFILEKEGGRIDAWEAKYDYPGTTMPKNLQSFTSQYGDILDRAAVISRQNYAYVGRT